MNSIFPIYLFILKVPQCISFVCSGQRWRKPWREHPAGGLGWTSRLQNVHGRNFGKLRTQRCRIEATMTDGRANGIVNVAYEIAKRKPLGGITQIQRFSSHLCKASESMGAGAHISMNTNHLNHFCARIVKWVGDKEIEEKRQEMMPVGGLGTEEESRN